MQSKQIVSDSNNPAIA